jgi:hypothetical protein
MNSENDNSFATETEGALKFCRKMIFFSISTQIIIKSIKCPQVHGKYTRENNNSCPKIQSIER